MGAARFDDAGGSVAGRAAGVRAHAGNRPGGEGSNHCRTGNRVDKEGPGHQGEDKALEKDSIVNCDETWCKVRRFNKYMKKYMWVLVNKAERIMIYVTKFIQYSMTIFPLPNSI